MLISAAIVLVWERAVQHALTVSGAEFYDVEIALTYVKTVAYQRQVLCKPIVRFAALQVLAKLDAGHSPSTLSRKLRADWRAAQTVRPPDCNTGVRPPAEDNKYHPMLIHYLKGY